MNEESLRNALKYAYQVEAYAKPFEIPTAKRGRPLRIVIFAALATAALLAVAGFYPPFRANLFCRQLADRLKSQRGYQVTMTSVGPDSPGSYSQPAFFTFRGSDMTDWHPGNRLKFDIATSQSFRQCDPSTKTCQTYPVQHINPVLNMLDSLSNMLDSLGKVDLSKRIVHVGTVKVSGKEVNRTIVRMNGVEKAKRQFADEQIRIDLDPQTGLPLEIISSSPDAFDTFTGSERYVFGYDPSKVDAAFAAADTRGYREIDFAKMSAAHWPTLGSKRFGRDLLTIYKVEENKAGDIFVLYSLNGYHSDAEHRAGYLYLRDDSGKDWLQTVISLDETKLRVNGLNPKAQIFYPPEGPRYASSVTLHVNLLDGWEFDTNGFMGALAPNGIRLMRRPLGGKVTPVMTVHPTLVDSCPDWFRANRHDASLPEVDDRGNYLRMEVAAARGDYRNSGRLAKELLDNWRFYDIGFAGQEGFAAAIRLLSDWKLGDVRSLAEDRPVLEEAVRKEDFPGFQDENASIAAEWLALSRPQLSRSKMKH